MEEKRDKNIEAIAKIIELTRANSLKWHSVNNLDVQKKSNDIISYVFSTSYKKKILRIFKRQYQGRYQDINTLAIFARIASPISASKKSELRWYEEVILELVDGKGTSLWAFPKEDILNDLLKTIKYKVSGADDLINSLLEE
ncbi:hypothetical protein QUF75_05335 [Desulfococcaceae bacterium HSG7]|nr:hypothetical protein [Desulfococcaceae bacterium HSG7]